MNGAHRRDGMLVLAGDGVAPAGEIGRAEIADVLPTLLPLAGLPVPAGLDGTPITSALRGAPGLAPDTLSMDSGDAPAIQLDAVAETEVAARLAALGYREP